MPVHCALLLASLREKNKHEKWKREVFGNGFSNLSAAEDEVLIAQQAFDENPSTENLQLLNAAKNK